MHHSTRSPLHIVFKQTVTFFHQQRNIHKKHKIKNVSVYYIVRSFFKNIVTTGSHWVNF